VENLIGKQYSNFKQFFIREEMLSNAKLFCQKWKVIIGWHYSVCNDPLPKISWLLNFSVRVQSW